MSAAMRAMAAFLGLAWVVVLPLWMIGESIPSTLRSERVRAADWQRAMQAEMDLPHRWQSGHGRPPLLPVDGKLSCRGSQVLLTGTALVPGTFRTDSIALAVAGPGDPEAPYVPPRPPLIPFLGPPPEKIIPTQVLELCCGIQQPGEAQRQGLRVRYAKYELTVFGADAETPLFPPANVWHSGMDDAAPVLALAVQDNHVQVRLNGRLELDFHTTAPLPGAVGVTARDGALLLGRIEVTRPR